MKNFPLIAAFSAIILTQLLKYPIARLFKRSAQLDIVTSTGGMPSSHSAATSALITALTLEYGFSSPYVAIAAVFGVIVMFDSMGVRRQSGEQGLILDELSQFHLKQSKEHQIGSYSTDEYNEMIIKNYLGHKPSEVIGGIITGIIITFVLHTLLNH